MRMHTLISGIQGWPKWLHNMIDHTELSDKTVTWPSLKRKWYNWWLTNCYWQQLTAECIQFWDVLTQAHTKSSQECIILMTFPYFWVSLLPLHSQGHTQGGFGRTLLSKGEIVDVRRCTHAHYILRVHIYSLLLSVATESCPARTWWRRELSTVTHMRGLPAHHGAHF